MSGSYPDYIAPEIGIPLMAILAIICWVQRSPDRRAARKARLSK
jgi:hypothetical protein